LWPVADACNQPGANEITIVGLTPTVDEHSIKVEGTGSAIISDIAVELLPNREIFQDIYPDSDEDKSDDESEEEEDEDDKDSPALAAVKDKLFILRDEQKRAKEIIASSESRLKILDAYGKQLDRKKGINIEESIETYRTEREKVFQDHMTGMVKDRELAKEIDEVVKEETKLNRLRFKEKEKAAKVKAKIQRAKNKEKEKIERREAEKLKEKGRIRKERENFWPRYCYSVRITLDATVFTPMSSRRASISSASDIVKQVEKLPEDLDGDAANPTCDLLLTYVTTSAFWSPSYDLQLSTTSNTATLCFDAQLTNATSETWANCKVTLSTSQTTFSGLEDAIPTLTPWRIKLAAKGSGIYASDLLDSKEERTEQVAWKAKQSSNYVQKPRANLFGVGQEYQASWSNNMNKNDYQSMPSAPQAQQMAMRPMAHMQMPLGGIAQSNAMPMMRSSAAPRMAARKGGMMKESSKKMAAPGGGGFNPFGSGPSASTAAYADGGAPDSEDEEEEGGYGDDGTIMEPQPELDFQESAIEETGFTTTYDLPGQKTLAPKTTASKQRVARISFANVVFSHTVIAKYKPVAYLKAKLKNSSKLTLLKGPAGLTLDGSFMGRTSLPRCSAGDTFSLSLGVDPAIKVIYPKPEVRRATTGLFSKEDSSVYTRTVTIANSRATAGRAVTLMVLDQAPVSEDERLKVEILAPRGMSLGGPGIAAGIPGRDTKEDKEWGKATATLKKAGEVCWDVSLNAGKAVKLGLEYVVALPSGDYVMQC
jgi:hypothetical protein